MRYKFNEKKLLKEFRDYIDITYKKHYTSGKPKEAQTFELMGKIPLRALFFAIGNILKYGDRYGSKSGFNRDDLVKIVHYGFLALWAHDKMVDETSPDHLMSQEEAKNVISRLTKPKKANRKDLT